MFNGIRRLASPPVFEDEDKTRQARLLNTVALAFLVVSVVGSLLMVIGAGMLSGLINGAAFALLELAVLFLLRRGRVLLAGIIQTGVLWLIVTAFNVAGDGLRAPTFSSYILVVLLASLLLGRYYGMGTALLSVIAGLGMLVAEGQGWISFVGAAPTFALIAQSTHFVLAAVLIGLALSGLHQALDSSRESYRQLQDAQSLLEQQMDMEREQREQMQRLAQGEQSQRERLQGLLAQVHEAANRISSASAEILATVSQQASGASEQSTAIAQASGTIEEVRTSADHTAEMASAVAGLARRTAEVAQSGQQAVIDTITGMGQVKEQVESIASGISHLSAQTEAITVIISTVNEIASQSNLLALNAAVEAARAGQAGRGFAVVAKEVRSLAEQSRAATAQVRTILTEIQHGVRAVDLATEEGMRGVDGGMNLAGEAGTSIQTLADNVRRSTDSAQQITAAATQQLTGMEQISLAMDSIRQVAAQNAAGARQVEEAAGKLNDLALQLRVLVGQQQS